MISQQKFIMRNQAKLILFLFLIPIFHAASAQRMLDAGVGRLDQKDIDDLKSRKVIVMIEEPVDFVLKNLRKHSEDGTVAEYQQALHEYNDNMKTVVENFWPYKNGAIEYKTRKEIEALKKQKTSEHIVVMCHSFNSYVKSAPGSNSATYVHIPLPGIWWWKGIEEQRPQWLNTVLVAQRIEKFTMSFVYKKPLLKVVLFDRFPTKAALVFGVNDFKMFVDAYNAFPNEKKERVEKYMSSQLDLKQAELPQKTLLIRKDWLDKGLSADDIKLYYPYPYQVCDAKTMGEISMEPNSTSKYSYAIIMPRFFFSPQHLVIDPTDHRDVFRSRDEDVTFTMKTFKAVAESVSQVAKK